MPDSNYKIGTSHLVDYAIKHFGAEIIGIEKLPELPAPVLCLTGASNTTCIAKIQEKCTYQILAVGDDTLELNFGIDAYRYADEFQRLGELIKEIQSGGYKLRGGKEVDWFGEKFHLLGHGSSGGYKYLAKNGDIELQMMPEAMGGKKSPELRVQFRSEFLWGTGEIDAINKVIEFIHKWAVISYCRVSRADPCVDLSLAIPEIDLKQQLVSRIRKKRDYFSGKYLDGMNDEGYTFGVKGICHYRIYDKVLEQKKKKKAHMLPVWKSHGYIEDSPDTRFELELKRPGLTYFNREMTPEQYFSLRADIFHHMTNKNFRIVDSGSATRKERCKETAYWHDIQTCEALFGERTGALPYKEKNPQLEQLRSQARGVYATMYAILCAEVGEKEALSVMTKEYGKEAFDDIILAGKARVAKYSHLRGGSHE